MCGPPTLVDRAVWPTVFKSFVMLGLDQRGPITYALLATLQKRDNLQATSNKMIIKTIVSEGVRIKNNK